MRGSVPRPYMNVQGTAEGLTVRGLEVVHTLETSQLASVLSVGLNPAQAQVFPRLSGLALQFERYRFNSIRAHYFTACPATRSGSLGIAIHTEYTPNAKVPTTGPAFATYEYSRVGTVSESMSAPEWRVKDPEFFYIGSGTLAQDDVLKVFQGSLVSWIDNSVSTDAELLAGYLAVEYDVSFRSWRPTQQRCLSTRQSGAYTTVTGGGPQVVPVMPFSQSGVSGQQVGSFEQDRRMDEVADSKTVATFDVDDAKKKVLSGLASGAKWAWDYYMGVGGATVTSLFRKGRGLSSLTPIVVLDQSDTDEKTGAKIGLEDGVTISGYYNPKFIEAPPFGYLPYPSDEKHDGGLISRLFRNKFLPDAAGDIAVTWYAYNPALELIQAVITDHYSLGTGAVALEESHQVTLPEGYTDIWLGVVPTGVENRVLSNVVLNYVAQDLGS